MASSIYTQTYWRVWALLWLVMVIPFANAFISPEKRMSITALIVVCSGFFLLAIGLWALSDRTMMAKSNRKKVAGYLGLSNATPRTLLLPIAVIVIGILINVIKF